MKGWRKILIGAGLYTLFLLMTFPAPWAAVAVAHFSQQRVQLLAPEGTIWHGKSSALVIDSHQIENFAWQLERLPLLWGTATAEVNWAENAHATLSLSRKSQQLRHADIRLPVELLRDFIPRAAEYGWGGSLRLQTDQLTWQAHQTEQAHLEGQARLEWYNARTVKLPVQPLGDYQIALQSTQKGIVSHISTLRGALTVNGTARWSSNDRLRFTGTLKPDPARQAEFTELINLTSGQADAQGAYHLGF
jgi:general secretion pathway protein N